jgi:hypothetical protein
MSDAAPAHRRGRAAGVASVAAGAAVAAATIIGWMNLERAERRALEVEISELQKQFAAALDAGLQLRFAALAPLGMWPAGHAGDGWPAAARAIAVELPATVGVCHVAADGTLACEPTERHDSVREVLSSLPAEWMDATAAGRVARAVPSMPGLVVLGVPAERGCAIVAVVDMRDPITQLLDSIDGRLRAHISVAPTTGGAAVEMATTDMAAPQDAPNVPPIAIAGAGLEWQVRLVPSAEWMAEHAHPGNTAFLAGGLGVGALAAVSGWLASDRRRMRRELAVHAREASGAVARASVAAHARDALSQEASHVIRARIRETARALDAATDARATPETRADALRRIGQSLAQAEAEAAALLEPPPQTRVLKAEEEAKLMLHFARAVLEFQDGPTVQLQRVVDPASLRDVQRALGADRFAVITSDNPLGTPEEAHANALRRAVLGLELRNARMNHWPVTGRSEDSSWSEHGFAVAASIPEADAIAEVHAQRAYYWFDGTRFSVHECVGQRRIITLPTT